MAVTLVLVPNATSTVAIVLMFVCAAISVLSSVRGDDERETRKKRFRGTNFDLNRQFAGKGSVDNWVI